MNSEKKAEHRTKIGGQAIIEGVMMKGLDKCAMSVRLPDGGIDTEVWEDSSRSKWYSKIPIVRGVFNLIDTFLLGYRCLMKSADKAGLEEEEPSAFEQKLGKIFGNTKVLNGIVLVVSLVLAVFLFVFLPAFAVRLLRPVLHFAPVMTIIEGLIKIGIFVAYLFFVAKMAEIRRVFQYHGAEHKSIACYEHGDELTPENAKKYIRFHPRCGTSFMILVLIISILVSSFISWNNLFIRVLLKVLLLPVVAGISYELIKIAGRYDNIFTRIISAPGLWLQRLTTCEPDEGQLEVALASLKAVLPEEGQDDQW